ncbi:aminopeptidase N [Streptomyces sp. TRM66268-LWL]|uniref:Aminopeptidase N n=1 Tax=Streptomyces polyasparticus TaxID=2767826 RepID=A0ABR7SCM5_9ACTN|nr:aminopeptidase N [Streptomyces polyasparticus]MBC9712088.1 aminopeptidase N [Streptomyces polyasparticus]
MSVLTRDEAQTRARLLEVQRYEVAVDLTRGEETFDSRTVIRFTAREAGDTFVDLKAAELREAALDGQPLDPESYADGRLPLKHLTAGEHELTVDAEMRYSHTGEGMHRFTDPADGETYLYTQLCMDDAQRVFAAFDQPDLKAVFAFTVTAPEGWTVLGNGIAKAEGQGRWTIADTPRISTYLAALAAGPYHSVTTEHRGLPFGIHCRRSLAPHLDVDADEILDATKALFDRYHEKFTEPYPFDSYDQAFVPEFNAGAMENPGLVTFRDEFIYRSAVTDTERQTRIMVIAHEMAHMWFGDLVTLRWWDDIWLNESFAEYMGYQTTAEVTRFSDTWTDFGIARKTWGYDSDQRPTTHPVAPKPELVPDTGAAQANFDGISYAKGASALRQLVAWLGDKDFSAGINAHFARHKFANATLADFIENLASATDRDVHEWARVWLGTTGVDKLTPAVTETGNSWQLTVTREGGRPHRIGVAAYEPDLQDDGALVLRERFELDIAAEHTETTRSGRRPALLVLNDQDLTYTKIRLDEQSQKTALGQISGIPETLNRTVLWNALRDMVRDGELAPAAYLEAARTHLPKERDLAIVQGVLAFAGTQVTDRYLAPEDRPGALTLLSDLCEDIIRLTEDGSSPGARLTAVRHFIDHAQRADVIRAWFDEGTVPGGPELDPELRWRLLTRLAVLGAIDDDVIEAELLHDPSASGQEGAARCRAALPDPAAKEAAWEAMFGGGDTLSNYLFVATAQGFWQPEQLDLVRPYVTRFFTDAVATAKRRGPALADGIGRHAVPIAVVEPATLELGERCLAEAEVPPPLRRRLADHMDDLARALRVRGVQ